MAIEWKITPPIGATADEDDGISNYAVAQFTAIDDGSSSITYSLESGATDYFDITSDGQLNLKSAFDADNALKGVFSVVVKATSADGAISSVFILTANNINDEVTEWLGAQTAIVAVSETIGVENLRFDLTTSEYQAVATFTPKDADGNEFGYGISGDYAWMFEIDKDGVLKLKFELDYESAWFDTTNFSISIWAGGVSGGAPANEAAGIWVSQNFVLSVVNVDDFNDSPITWSGEQTAIVAVEETSGVENLRFDLTVDEYVAVATFTPSDADGNEFGYGISGDYAWMFEIGSDGVLKLKYELDYESVWFDTTNFAVTIWAGGLSKGTPTNQAAGVWISQNFVLSVVNVDDPNQNDQITEWSGVQPTGAAITETAGVTDGEFIDNPENSIILATFDAKDADGDDFEYLVAPFFPFSVDELYDIDIYDGWWMFDIGTDGVLKLSYNVDYESTWYSPIIKFTVFVYGTSGGDAIGDAEAFSLATSQHFTLTILNVDDPKQNDQITEWDGPQQVISVITETAGVVHQEEITYPINYVPVALFTPKDADGGDFEYKIEGDYKWLFDIGADGILKVKYELDYESRSLSSPIEVIIWARGTTGGDGIGDGAVWISQHFTLSILNVDEDGVNDSLTTWSGTQPTNFAISETAGLVNQEEITDPASYVAVATFTPKDADGDGFKYDIESNYEWLFDIGTDGVLKVKYNLDYESMYYPPVVTATILAHGTTGSTEFGDGPVWISQNFTLSILNIEGDPGNTNPTTWSGTQPTLATVDEDVTVVGSTEGGKPPQAIATFTASDADGDQFEYFIDEGRFEIDSNGVLYTTAGFNYEELGDVDEKISITIWARGTSGGNPTGDALPTGTIYGWITTNFVLSIADVVENSNPTEWDGTAPTGATLLETVNVENQGELTEANYVAVATLIPTDPDGNDFQYAIDGGKNPFWLIGTDGVLKVKYALDYESALYPPIVGVTIWANGTSGNPYTNANGNVWVSHNFALTIIDGNDTDRNEYQTEWSGTLESNIAVSETPDVINQGPELSNYKVIGTFKPLDTDGNEFQYSFDTSKAGWWLFDFDPSTGIVSLKYELDYESAWYPPVIDATLWINGTSGNPNTEPAGAVWISHNFTLSIENVNEAINDEATKWSGEQTTIVAVSETAGVENLRFDLTTGEYKAVATFTPKDEDKDANDNSNFGYFIAGDYAWMFDIGTDGVLKLKFELDYESVWFDTTNFAVTIWTWGTDGGAAAGDATAVSQNFVLSVVNVDEDIVWSGGTNTDIDATFNEIAGGFGNVMVGDYSAYDPDGTAVSYEIGGDAADYFSITSDGALWAISNIDYENSPNGDGVYSITVRARSDDTPITASLVWNLNNINDELTAWSGNEPAGASLLETIDVANQGELTAGNYVAVATLTPSDADGSDFTFAIQGNKDQFWLFDIGTDGILKVKYSLDYESAWYPPVAKTTIWVHGLSGSDKGEFGAGTTWISHNFALTILNDNEDGINDSITEWSGTQDSIVAVEEITGVENLRFDLTVDEYKAVATFTPKDADGDEFGYFIAGEYAWMFEIDSEGVLKLKYELDYESAWFDTTNFAVTIWAWGTDGGAAVGDAGGISQNFVLSVVNINEDNINDSITTWSGTPATNIAVSETAGVENQQLITDSTSYVAVATFTPLDDDDVDGNEFQYSFDTSKAGWWLFDYDPSSGELSLKYDLDYESAWYPPVVDATLWLNGTAGGEAVGDGTIWISHNFTLSILDINDPEQNDQPTEWSGTQDSLVTM
ncbi:MAG: cadherin repeat domain-containing protein, partial [Alphaproteobacteria bacterium]